MLHRMKATMSKPVRLAFELCGKLSKEVLRKVLTTFQPKRILYLETSSTTPLPYLLHAADRKRYDRVTGTELLVMDFCKNQNPKSSEEVEYK